jgi:hypothetical protein
MLCEELKQVDRSGLWRAGAAIGLCLGLAVPAWGQDEAPEEESAPLQATAVPDANDQVVILSNGIPTTELRIREPGVRTHENLHGIGERTDPASIPTLGPESQAVETIYHGTLSYGEPDGIPTRSGVGTRVIQPITTHEIASPPPTSRIRYHGGFR